MDSVYKAVVLEKIAEMAIKTITMNPASFIPSYVMDKHYYRKHGSSAYYGQ